VGRIGRWGGGVEREGGIRRDMEEWKRGGEGVRKGERSKRGVQKMGRGDLERMRKRWERQGEMG